MTEQQFAVITAWQKETFGQATALSKLNHLDQEIQELKTEIESRTTDVFTEFADCFILLFGAAASHGLSYKDICDSIDYKMVVNRSRKWGKPDENGVVNHIKTTINKL